MLFNSNNLPERFYTKPIYAFFIFKKGFYSLYKAFGLVFHYEVTVGISLQPAD